MARRSGPGPELAKHLLDTELELALPPAISPDSLFAITEVEVCPDGIGSTGAYWAKAAPADVKARTNIPAANMRMIEPFLG